MPANQPPLVSAPMPIAGASKSPLVRSKSLRLPPAKPKPDFTTSTLTRHGSIRQTKAQSAAAAMRQQPLSVLRKPLVKPKPVFSSKSTENLSSRPPLDGDHKRGFVTYRSQTKLTESHPCNKGVTFNESHPGSSDSSTPSDRGQSSKDMSWTAPDLASHVKRLAEEHEKLQVEYARTRMQYLELSSIHPNTLLRKEQSMSHSETHLASIPENSPQASEAMEFPTNDQTPEAMAQIYRNEITRLQDENRKLQRKYWGQVLCSESIEDVQNGGASQQVVELIDKLDEKQRELVQSTGRVQELENHLAAMTLELHQCQDALQDYQHTLEDSLSQKEKLEKVLKESHSSVVEMRETVEFLQEERSTLAEALQETEQSLSVSQAEKKLCDTRLNDLMTRARKLYAKVHDKNLQIQLLQADLDRTEGRARDMLLSQGAELTMTAMNLSEISISLHTLFTSTSDFAANELELQKEMLDEIMADLDSDSDKNDLSPTDEKCIALNVTDAAINSKDLIFQTAFTDMHKSLPDLPSSQLPSSPLNSSSLNADNAPVSLVQTILCAAEGPKNEPQKSSSPPPVSSDESPSNSVNSSSENLLSTASDGKVNKVCFGRPGAFKPVGTAIPFRPVSQSNREISSVPQIPDPTSSEEEKRKASLEGQLQQMSALIVKLTKVIDLTQGKYLAKMTALKDEISLLKEEILKHKEIQKNLNADLKCKSQQNKMSEEKLSATSNDVKNMKQGFDAEKGELLKEISDLKESNKGLEAVKKELTRQLKEEIQQLSEPKSQGSAHFTDAVAICDKLLLKQEVVNLKEKLAQKEQMLQILAQKFSKTKKVLEDNVQKADSEVACLDSVIQKVYESLQGNPDLVDSSEVIRNIYMLVSGNNPPEEYRNVFKRDATVAS